MRATDYVEVLGDNRVRCTACQWRCELAAGKVGACGVRTGAGDAIEATAHGLVSAAQIGPIEDYRLWHFLPGTPVLAIGGWGYALPFDRQHAQYALPPADPQAQRRLEPDRAALFALERLCRGVVWSFSEPAVAPEYVLDLLRTARANSRYTAIVTSGYSTLDALDRAGLYLDGMLLDLRAFDDQGYRRLAGLEQWRGILEVAAHARTRWNCHIEVVTRVHHGVNDGSEMLTELVAWIRDTLGDTTPWHALPGDAGASAAAAASRARRIGLEGGLRYVYSADAAQDTLCYACGALLVERGPGGGRVVGVQDGRCRACDTETGLRLSIFKR